MVNYEIQYTGKFDMLTYFLGTNSVVVLSPDCILISIFYACGFHVETVSVNLKCERSEQKREENNSVLRSTATNSLKNIGMMFKI